MEKISVLLVGLKASAADFSKWPELSVEKLEKAFKDVQESLESEGFDAKWCLTDTGETAEEQLRNELKSREPDIVLIGAGVRKDPDLLLLFEKMINTIISESPKSKIAFNTLPFDSVEAVKRWV